MALLFAAFSLTACWQSYGSLLDATKAVQPIDAGSYVEHDPEDPTSAHMIAIERRGAGYRTQWGINGEVLDIIFVPLRAERFGMYAFAASEPCADASCPPERAQLTYYGVIGVRKDGKIERIDPERANPDNQLALTAGATCDSKALCNFRTQDVLMAALSKLADMKTSFIYERSGK